MKKVLLNLDYRNPNYGKTPSNWELRNNSGNIASILHPNHPTTQSNRSIRNATVAKKPFLSTNDCYCRETNLKPKLLARPKSCIINNDGSSKNLDDNWFRKSLVKNPSMQRLLSNHYLGKDYYPDQNDDDRVVYSKQRLDYENYLTNKEQNEFVDKEIELMKKKELVSSQISDGDDFESEKFESAEKLNEFRRSNYFDTHSTEDLLKEVPKHECIYEFSLDERMEPKAVNPDGFGRSKCKICDKPMEHSASRANSRNDNKSSVSRIAKAYQMGLMPKLINISNGNSQIQVKVDRFDLFMGKIRNPQYTNTLALRQQRMAL